jgi:8-oxo-dGTP pyrophosphatase MutT (NUDIX family)
MMHRNRHRAEDLVPSATIILLRDDRGALETLLLRRRQGRDPFAGAWVFPGGAVEETDGPIGPGQAWPPAARHAAVRELQEEAGLALSADSLVPFSDWTSPTTMPRRFRTWFFLATAPAGVIQLQRQEVNAYRWMAPRQVLAAHRSQVMALFPPTWVSLVKLATSQTVSQTLDRHQQLPPEVFRPRVGQLGPSRCFFYEEDAGYDDLDGNRPGPRHRLVIHPEGWYYECDPGEKHV